MKPAPFGYHSPTTIDDVVSLYDKLDNARPLAGGQSLVPMMNFRYAVPDHLIDLNNVADLRGLNIGERISIGAMTRQRDLEFSQDLERACPILREALLNVGHRQTRNRGTIGGSLCHLDPSAEISAIMMLHDATLSIRKSGGSRNLKMSEFALGFMTTALEANEVLTHVEFETWPTGHRHAFEEYARRHGDFAIASAGVLLDLDETARVRRMAIVIGGVEPVPVRLTEMETAAVGERVTEELIAAVADAASRLDASSDAHVSGQYRRHLASVLSARALRRAVSKSTAGVPLHA